MTKDAAATASHVSSVSAGHTQDSTTVARRRNAGRHGTWVAAVADRDRLSPAMPADGGAVGVRGGSVRDAWVRWLAPTFPEGSAYITGTYSDDYGFPNGLTLPRNVHKDVVRFFDSTAESFLDLSGRRWICGVEKHQYRDILHWHGIISGPFTADELRYLQLVWQCDRGYAKVLPVTDGCASYVTKYALKGDTDSFEWRL